MEQYRNKLTVQVFMQVTEETFDEAVKICDQLKRYHSYEHDLMVPHGTGTGHFINDFGCYLVKDQFGRWNLWSPDFLKEWEPVSAPSVSSLIEFKDIPEPLGSFVLNQTDIPYIQLPDGAYWHYTSVLSLLGRYKPDYRIKQWQELFNPLFEYANGHPEIKLGSSIVQFVLDRAKRYDAGQIAGVQWVKTEDNPPKHTKGIPVRWKNVFGNWFYVIAQFWCEENKWVNADNGEEYSIVGSEYFLDESGSSPSTAAKDYEKLYKEANQFILDLAKEFGEDSLGFDGIQWSIEDFKEAARNWAAAKEQETAIAFMRWNARMYVMGIDRQVDQWFDHRGECVALNTNELFKLFLQSQTKQQL